MPQTEIQLHEAIEDVHREACRHALGRVSEIIKEEATHAARLGDVENLVDDVIVLQGVIKCLSCTHRSGRVAHNAVSAMFNDHARYRQRHIEKDRRDQRNDPHNVRDELI